ncbi:hypothetical protein MTR_5g030790 [Medicago truncatula]|uniref:Uncharacterized protein n=1 Tax=Medicago truncatula TaxID=3880 RepID=G7KF62_MEDTR|nr:hypothetical protein MTR_5g030790 [Medicago truncatula]
MYKDENWVGANSNESYSSTKFFHLVHSSRVMVENADDDPGETKLFFVENFGDVKPPKVEAKPNIDGVSVNVEASSYVDSGVVPLDANEVDTAHCFFEEVKWKDRDDFLN